jgi:preprotein translocase subunit SecG
MYIFLLIIHVIISIALIMIILAQSSKGGALDGLVGGTASTMLGSHGASAFLSKWTKILGAVWVLSSLILAMNVRAMHAPSRARALERLREETTTDVPPPAGIDELQEGEVLPEQPAPVTPGETSEQPETSPETAPESTPVPVE